MEFYDNPWLYQGTFFDPELVGDNVGFVYEIKNIETGERYIGQKKFTKAGYKQVKGKKKKIRKDSGWRDYYGSGPRWLESMKGFPLSNFRRVILRICKTKGECNYYESKTILEVDALLKKIYINDWCQSKISRAHLKHLQEK